MVFIINMGKIIFEKTETQILREIALINIPEDSPEKIVRLVKGMIDLISSAVNSTFSDSDSSIFCSGIFSGSDKVLIESGRWKPFFKSDMKLL
jgi:hypothetical protein